METRSAFFYLFFNNLSHIQKAVLSYTGIPIISLIYPSHPVCSHLPLLAGTTKSNKTLPPKLLNILAITSPGNIDYHAEDRHANNVGEPYLTGASHGIRRKIIIDRLQPTITDTQKTMLKHLTENSSRVHLHEKKCGLTEIC